jgi:hypothetical protein
MVLTSRLKTIGSNLDPQVWHFTLILSWLTNDTSLVAQLITPLCWVNLSILRMTSIPSDLSTTKSARKTTHLKWSLYLNNLDDIWCQTQGFRLLGVILVVLWVFYLLNKTWWYDECDALESNNTVASTESTKNSPSTTPEAVWASWAWMWLTWARP